MGKEKGFGALILILAFLVLIYYTWGLVILQNPWFGPAATSWAYGLFPPGILRDIFVPDWRFLVMLPIWLAVVLIAVIGMWIGWTMVTTPAPEPLEDFDFEEEKKPEAKPEEKKPESKAPQKGKS
ncbi:MAG: hypothetical protein C4K47_06365 [Candidatus Thorarchaeota archaeon]|nr:MAG: hypothetical protein C4K47_06365 [Candidatus Thorarchaeota archaeon]